MNKLSAEQSAKLDEMMRHLQLHQWAEKLPWYDAVWLHRYYIAQDTIKEVQPTALPDFIDALAPLQTDPAFQIQEIGEVFDAETLQRVRDTIATLSSEHHETHEINDFGRLVVHDNPYFIELQRELTDRVSVLAGEEVEPCYNFLSLYSDMGICEPHMDAPSAKWTLDICIDQSDEWPIKFSEIISWPKGGEYTGNDWQDKIKADPNINFTPYTLRPNRAILFSGSSQWHYRDAIPVGKPGSKPFCNLLFFHYIPKGMAELVDPGNWARYFNIPELAGLGLPKD